MPTRVRRDPQSSAERRRISLALLVALLLHVPVFLSPGAWRFGSLRDTAPTLELRIELQEGYDGKDIAPPDEPPEVEQLAARTPEPKDLPEPRDVPEPGEALEPTDVEITGVDERVADQEPLPAAETPAPNELPVPLDSVAQATDAAAADFALEEPVLAQEAAPSADAVVATIAPVEERALTRRVMREASELLSSGVSQREVAFRNDGRNFAVVLTRDPATDGMGIERITAEVVTEQGGKRAHTSMQMKRLAFSHFTQLVDRWDPQVALHDDEIAGRFHSNTAINVSYDRKVMPRLLGKVSTVRGIRVAEEPGQRWRWRVPNRRIFVGGLDTRAARIRFPEISLSVARRHATANADVHALSSSTLIVFYADGGYDCVDRSSRVESRRLGARPTYIVGVPGAELRVRGVINGNVTVYSPELIVVQGNLTYAQGRSADDYLGLVSDGNVEIDHADVTGPGDLEIHAAVYARKRFVVRNTNARRSGTLFLYGSLTAGSLSETEPRYATRIEFDPRFERVRPPGFPETDRYEIEEWDGRWKVTEGLAPG